MITFKNLFILLLLGGRENFLLLINLVFLVFDSASSYCIPCNTPATEWSEWSEWSLCSQQYGAYSKTRTRTCLNSAVSTCEGASSESIACLSDSPTTPEWNSWGEWSGCSASCGGGSQYRQRTCNTHCGVCQCQGPATEQRECNTQSCCHWNEWSAWSQCSVTCGVGGVQSRTRDCTCGNVSRKNEIPYLKFSKVPKSFNILSLELGFVI